MRFTPHDPDKLHRPTFADLARPERFLAGTDPETTVAEQESATSPDEDKAAIEDAIRRITAECSAALQGVTEECQILRETFRLATGESLAEAPTLVQHLERGANLLSNVLSLAMQMHERDRTRQPDAASHVIELLQETLDQQIGLSCLVAHALAVVAGERSSLALLTSGVGIIKRMQGCLRQLMAIAGLAGGNGGGEQ